MINAILVTGQPADDTPIPFIVETTIPQNGNVVMGSDDSTLLIKEPGVYEITGVIQAKSTKTGIYGAYIAANVGQVGDTFHNSADDSGIVSTIPINAVLNVKPSESGYVEIQIMPIGSPVIDGGNVTIKRII